MTFDPYESRTGATAALAERPDPVVWGDTEGPLPAEEVARYERDGFVRLERWLDDDACSVLLAEAARLEAARDGERVMEPDESAVRSVFRLHRDSKRVARLIANERLAGVAEQLLGSAVYVHQSRVNFKPGFRGAPFQWHSDFETWHAEDGMPRPRALSASVMLSDNYPYNGPMMVIPGSHRTYVRCPGGTPDEHFKESLRAQQYGVPSESTLTCLAERGAIEQVCGPPGTVVFFDSNLMHGSAANMTPYPRHNLFVVFNSVENTLVAPFGGTARRPAFLAERTPRAIRVRSQG